MARRVFFSFHYEDIFRVNVVRNAHIVEGCSAAGFQDASMWEDAKRKGDAFVKRLIDASLDNTSVTVVLIGAHTAGRQYVTYEIERSLERGNGLLGVHIYNIKDLRGRTGFPGPPPAALIQAGGMIYTWDRDRFGAWVEEAYHVAQRKQGRETRPQASIAGILRARRGY